MTRTIVTLKGHDGEADRAIQDSFGPVMARLTDKQRAFVMALVLSPDDNATSAAAAAGYAGERDALAVTGSRLRNHPNIQAAIHEESERRLHGAKLLATRVLVEVMGDTKEKTSDRLKAVGMTLNRVGMAEKTEHKVTVEHNVSEKQLIAEIMEMSKSLGIDAAKLLGTAGVTIDAEFTEVKPDPLAELGDLI